MEGGLLALEEHLFDVPKQALTCNTTAGDAPVSLPHLLSALPDFISQRAYRDVGA